MVRFKHPLKSVLMALLICLVPLVCVQAGEKRSLPEPSPQIVETPLISGRYWGWKIDRVAEALDISVSSPSKGISPEWYVHEALLQLWKADPKGDYGHVHISEKASLVTRKGKLLGYLGQTTVDERWQEIEAEVIKKFKKEPTRIHFGLTAPKGTGAPNRYAHIYRWEGGKSQFIFLKGTIDDLSKVWVEEKDRTVRRVTVQQKVGDPRIPLVIGAFDVEQLKKMRGIRHSHKGGEMHYHPPGHSHKKKKKKIPDYFIPLKPVKK